MMGKDILLRKIIGLTLAILLSTKQCKSHILHAYRAVSASMSSNPAACVACVGQNSVSKLDLDELALLFMLG